MVISLLLLLFVGLVFTPEMGDDDEIQAAVPTIQAGEPSPSNRVEPVKQPAPPEATLGRPQRRSDYPETQNCILISNALENHVPKLVVCSMFDDMEIKEEDIACLSSTLTDDVLECAFRRSAPDTMDTSVPTRVRRYRQILNTLILVEEDKERRKRWINLRTAPIVDTGQADDIE